jgi:hypothetical protein
MLLLRLVGTLTAIAIGAGIVAYLFTGERRYLGLAWRIAKYALLFTFVILALLLLERVVAFV